eukprot:COSAG05_NODE_532_length_8897_cov_18.622301_5_plen_90_part_00
MRVLSAVYKCSQDNPPAKMRLGRLGPKCYFGERAVMSSSGRSHIRVRTVVARSTCHFAVLDKDTMDFLREEYEVTQVTSFSVLFSLGCS